MKIIYRLRHIMNPDVTIIEITYINRRLPRGFKQKVGAIIEKALYRSWNER
jgi:hypothetical protein